MGSTLRWHVHKERQPRNDYERRRPWLVDYGGRRVRRVPSRDEAFTFITSWYRNQAALPDFLCLRGGEVQ